MAAECERDGQRENTHLSGDQSAALKADDEAHSARLNIGRSAMGDVPVLVAVAEEERSTALTHKVMTRSN